MLLGMMCGLGCLISLLALPLDGAEWWSEQLGCAMDFPEGEYWISPPMPPNLQGKALQTIDGDKTISLLVTKFGGNSLDEKSVRKFENDFYSKTGAKKTKGSWTKVDGRSAYKSEGMLDAKGVKMQTVVLIVLDRGDLYQIMALKRRENPLDDRELLRCIQSFRFLSPPVTLVELIGEIVVKVLLLVLVIWGVSKLFQKMMKMKERQQQK